MARVIRRRLGRPAKKRQAGAKRRMMRKRVGRSGARTQDYAKVVEIQETKIVAVNNAAGESLGGVINFCLQDFQRPQEVAHAYKYYRASKVEISFIPYFNIAQTNGTGATQLPQLYYSVDRVSNRWIPPTETECLERGISPKLFNKKRMLKFKPNLLQDISLETSQPRDGTGALLGIQNAGFLNSLPVFNKWLPTQQGFGYNANPAAPPNQTNQVLAPNSVNPYALRYHGAIFCPAIEGLAPNTSLEVGDIQYKITWEFKGPRALATQLPGPEPNPYVGTSSQGGPHAVPNTQPTTYP